MTDLLKEFDTVDHNILISKLHHYNFQDVIISWFIDYFRNRDQYVFINGCVSAIIKLNCRVPQGSFLGPSFISNLYK